MALTTIIHEGAWKNGREKGWRRYETPLDSQGAVMWCGTALA